MLAIACVRVEEPPCPSVELPESQGGNDRYCQCDPAAITGRVFRFTRLEIDEPDAFASILNTMWQGDIENNILNVLVRVDKAIPGSTTAFDSLTLTAGPGWRDPKQPWELHAASGDPPASVVKTYCLLKGLSIPLTLLPYHGEQCVFKNAEDASLYFHSGPRDWPMTCAPDNNPPNNIPVSNLKLRLSFNRDCTEVRDSFLEGCITQEAADHICMCTKAPGTCPRQSKPGYAFDQKDLVAYCHDACGQDFISFGGLVRSFGLPPSCLTPEGKPGYAVQGFFDAVAITDQFNPVSSDDCTEAAP